MDQLNTSFKNILKVTTPLVIAGVAMNLVGIVDIMLVANLGEAPLGGTGNGQILYAFLFVIGMGFTTAIQIFIGRRNGEHRYSSIGNYFYQGLYFAIFFALFLVVLIQTLLPHILNAIFESQNVVHFTIIYIKTRGWGVIFTLVNLLFIGFYVGITKTKILGVFTPLISVLNITLDIILINGLGPIPPLGVQGAAIASVIAEAGGTILFVYYTFRYIDLKKYGLQNRIKFNWKQTKTILKLANPIMLQNTISIGAWLTFFIFVEHLGERELAISQIIRGIYMFIMVPMFSLADATNTFVSNLMGEKRFELIIPLILKTSFLGVLVNVLFFLILNLYPDFCLGLFTSDPSVIQESLSTLKLTSYSMFVFTLAFMPFRAVSGTGNTRTALFIESLSVGIYLVFTYYVTLILESKLWVVWSSEFVYFGFMLLLSWLYLKFGTWRDRII